MSSRDMVMKLFPLLTGIWNSWVIATAVKLNIAENLTVQPLSINELANVTRSDENALLRLMRSLSSLGLFEEDKNGKWCLTPMAELLASTSKNSLKHHVLAIVEDSHLALAKMDKAVRSGKPVFKDVYGAPYYEYMKSNREAFNNLKLTLKGYTNIFFSQIPNVYDFSRFKHIIDIGGNDGSFLIHVLNRAINSKGTIFDERHVIEEAKENVEKSGISERCSYVVGNFFESVPPGGDCYILKLILLDWDDESALRIISNIAKQMKPGTRLLIIQSFLPESNEPHYSKLTDMVLLWIVDGKERAKKQFELLLAKAGLQINAIIPAGNDMFEIMEVVA